MPVVEINGIKFDVPDDASDAEIESIANEQFGQPKKSSRLASGWSGFSQGLTFGTSDEIGGALAAPILAGIDGDLSFGNIAEKYKVATGNLREKYKQERSDNPATFLTGELTGGLATGGAGVARTGGIKTLQGAAKAGAVGGGAAGAGYADASTVGEFVGDTALGAAAGAFLGKGGEKLGGAIKGAYNFVRPSSRVRDALTQNLKDAGLTVDDAVQALRESNGVKILADLAPEMQQRLSAVASVPGGMTRAAREFLTERVGKQYKRMDDLFNGELSGTNSFKAAKENLAAARDASRELYEEAYDVDVPLTPILRRIQLSDAGAKAFKQAQREVTNDLTIQNPQSQMAAYHIMLQTLRDKESKFIRAGVNNKARSVGNLARALEKELTNNNPAFKEAQTITRGAFEDNRAIELAQKVFREDVNKLDDAIADMSQTELINFKSTVFEEIYKKMTSKADKGNAFRDFNKKSVRDSIRVAFQDDAMFNKFMSSIKDEDAMFATFSDAVNNSLTASRQANRFTNPEIKTGVISAGINQATKAFTGGRTSEANRLAGSLLTNPNPDAVLRGLTQPALPSLNPLQTGLAGVGTGGSLYDLTQGS